jgi:type I restriction enzyme R subunit
MRLTVSIVEDAALEWFGELGYAVGHGPQLAPGEPAAERDSFGDVVLVGRLREAIRRLNPAIPEEARATIWKSRIAQFLSRRTMNP